MLRFLILCALGMTVVEAAERAPGHALTLHRAEHVGDHYSYRADGQNEHHVSIRVDGAPEQEHHQDFSITLDATVQVLAVGPRGRPARRRFTIISATKTVAGVEQSFLQKGSRIEVDASGQRNRITAQGTVLDADSLAELDVAIPFVAAGAPDDDAQFGCRTAQIIGGRWLVDSAAVADSLKRGDGLAVIASDIAGETMLMDVTRRRDVECLRVHSDIAIDRALLAVPDGVTVDASRFSVALDWLVPVDATQHVQEQSISTDGTITCSGSVTIDGFAKPMHLDVSLKRAVTIVYGQE